MRDPKPEYPVYSSFGNEFNLRLLPQVMRSVLGWSVSADVMQLWLSLPARQFTNNEKIGTTKPRDVPPQNINTELITWTWLNGFELVQQAEAKLMASLGTPNARRELEKLVPGKLKAQIKQAGQTSIEIRNNPQSPIDLHSDWQFQFAEAGYRVGKMDDLYGALGNFMLAAAVTKARLTMLRPGVARLSITEVGLYVRDTFEFNGQQYLGHWSELGLGIQPLATLGHNNKRGPSEWRQLGWHSCLGWLKPVNNSDFRTFRAHTGRGGDLLLFSDVKLKPVQIDVEVRV